MKTNNIKETFRSVFRVLKYIYLISSKYFILNLLFSLLLGFIAAANIWAVKILINGISKVNSENLDFVLVLGLFGLIGILTHLVQALHNYVRVKHQMKISYKINMDILDKCTKLGLQDFEDSEVYNVLSRAEIEGGSKIYSSYMNITNILTQFASVASISALILSWNSNFFLLILIAPIISTYVNTKIGYENYKMRMERMGDVRKANYLNFLLSNDIACKEIKAYNIGYYLLDKYSIIKKKIQNQDLKMAKKRTLWDVTLDLFDQIINLIVIFKIVSMAALGKILIGNTVAYIDSLGVIQDNVRGFLLNYSEIYNDMLYVNQFFSLLDLKVNVSVDKTSEFDEEIYEIEFKNVSYTYKGASKAVLSNVNTKICVGEFLAIVGENGSGKTTFIKLICGFYMDYEGEILINGIDIKKINTDSLRKRIGLVFQDFNKYEMTLRHNVGFGDVHQMSNDEKILDALETVELKENLCQSSEQIDIQMGNWFGGEELSRGQWQRIALSRAFLRSSDVYVLDEPTASLDPLSEKNIFNLVRKKSVGKICLIVTHRLDNIIEDNPRILMFSRGTLIGDDKHNMLKESNSIYRKLVEI